MTTNSETLQKLFYDTLQKARLRNFKIYAKEQEFELLAAEYAEATNGVPISIIIATLNKIITGAIKYEEFPKINDFKQLLIKETYKYIEQILIAEAKQHYKTITEETEQIDLDAINNFNEMEDFAFAFDAKQARTTKIQELANTFMTWVRQRRAQLVYQFSPNEDRNTLKEKYIIDYKKYSNKLLADSKIELCYPNNLLQTTTPQAKQLE